VVVAANVLHATADLGASLAHAHKLLAPGGWLILLEGTRRLSWLDLTFGLTDGWWRFSDTDRRPDHPLAPTQLWRSLLHEAGFDEVFSTTEERPDLAQDVILARVPRAKRRSRRWLISSVAPGADEPLARALAAGGATVERGARLATHPQAADESLGAVLIADDPLATGDAPLTCATAALTTIQDALRHSTSIDVCLVTRGAREIGDGVTAAGLAGAPLWGMARAARLEHPELRLRCIDLPGDDAPSMWEALARELDAIDPDDEVALREDGRWVPRLARPRDATGPTAGPRTPFRIAPAVSGHLDSLRPQPLSRCAPGPDEVEVRVRATGLNFRDLLQALGALGSGYADELSMAHMPFGFEASGVVERVGERVVGLAAGTPVIAAFTPGGLASHVTLPARFVIPKPATLGWAEAAALPTAWLTVWHGLDQLARLAPGERVLVHAAAGGVGTAAVRHAQSLGAELIATAHPRKWPALRAMGVQRIASSRDPSFADQVLAWTEGRGVDVVLNSLAGQLARRSLDVTAAGGRFVDLGKMSGLDNERARALRPDVDYHAFDLGILAARGGPDVDALLARLLERAASLALPTRAYSMGQAEHAFRDLQAGRHVGKLALTQPSLRAEEAPRIRADAIYVVTGGTGGLGLRVAAWLAEHGATEIALLARRAPDDQAGQVLAALASRGVSVRAIEADVSCRDSVKEALAEIRTRGAVRGVVHAAGVLDDALVEKLDRDRLRAVFEPKVLGALHLDELTRDDPLDFFVLFSSAAGLLGSPGQANHAAASAFLDALAWHRRAAGRPAISLDWGAWSEIGAAARKRAGERMRLVGVGEIDPDQGIAALARALAEDPVQLGVVPIDWSRFAGQPLAQRGFFSRVARSGPSLAEPAAAPALDLGGLDDQQRRQALDRHLRSHIAAVLGLESAGAVEPRSRLMDLGMDSLMAVELKRRLETTLGCSLRTTLMFDHPTVEALIAHLSGQLAPEPAAPEPTASEPSEPGPPLPALDGLDEIDGLSDAEVLERLRR
jgi:NADPH:quinone reductase-like Zn-dependent oxidoreductase/acyl carrier protein